MSDRAAGESIAQAIWTQDNETLTFYYGPPVSSGKRFKGETATAVWSGKDVTDNVDEIPGWVDSLGYSEDCIVHIVFDDSFLSVKPTNTHAWFRQLWGLKDIDLGGLDTSEVTDMSRMFSESDNLVSLDVSGFGTSELHVADGMFRGCRNLKTIYCQDNRDVWKSASGDEMFDSCDALVGSDGRSEIAYNKKKTGLSMAGAAGMGGYFTPKINTLVLKKTAWGDMFNLANTVKITWKAVPDAKYYKVYRKDITSGVQGSYELVFVTSKLVGWDKDPRLVDGHAYKYKIVASLTGKGDPSGNSPFAYVKTMYRLKTVVLRSAKNTEPGKVTVKYDKTKSGDSYVIGYSENEDMSGMKTKVVKGADSTSCTISGLKKGKTYYISIRVRKTVGGVNYYTTFGVPKKVTITN